MSLMQTKRASGVLNYNPGTFDNYCKQEIYKNDHTIDLKYEIAASKIRFWLMVIKGTRIIIKYARRAFRLHKTHQ